MLSLYVDGILASQATTTYAPHLVGSQVGAIGDGITSGTSGSYFTGQIEDIADYDYTLNASAIALHYAAQDQGGVAPEIAPQGGPVSTDAVTTLEGCGCQSTSTSSADPIPAATRADRADPVDTATGSFSETTTDLTVPGAGVPLSFSRTYTSLLAQDQLASGSTYPSPAAMGGLGYGWADNFAWSLTPGSTTATLTEPSGAETSYTYDSSEPWCSSEPAGPSGSELFCPSAPRVEAVLYKLSGSSGWELADDVSGQILYGFNSTGTLESITNATGMSLTSGTYGSCPSGDSCTEWTSSGSGRALVLEENSSGELIDVFATSGGNGVMFVYTGTGCSTWTSTPVDLCSVTDPDGGVTSFTYGSSNTNPDLEYDVLTETEPSGGTLTNTYDGDGSGRVTSQEDPAGDMTTFSYSASAATYATVGGANTTVTETPYSGGTAQTTVYYYSSGVLTGETVGSGAASTTTSLYRDSASLIPYSTVDGDGNATSSSLADYEFGGSGDSGVSSADVTTSTDALGDTTDTAYTPIPSGSGPPANLVYCSVEPAEVLAGVSCPSSPPTSIPSRGYLSSSTPAAICAGSSPPSWCAYLGATITYYDTAGNPVAVTDPDGYTSITDYTTTADGVPAELAFCQIDAVEYSVDDTPCPSYGSTASGTTTSTYDSSGDLTSQTGPTGATTSYTYSPDSSFPYLPTTITDPNHDFTTDTYDGAGQLTKSMESFDTYSATTVYGYDSAGRLYCTISPLAYSQGHTSCQSPVPTSPPTAGSDPWPDQQITIFNADNQPTYQVNPLGGVTQTAYNAAGQVYCTVSAYNYADGVTCPSETAGWTAGTTFTSYDSNGRPTVVTNPLGGTTTTTYDAANNVLSTTVQGSNSTSDPNVVTDYSYDADNRLTATTVDPTGGSSTKQETEESYDPDGNVLCTVSANAAASTTDTPQCPAWQPSWINQPQNPSTLYSTSPASDQANNVTVNFYDPDGNEVQTTNPDEDTTATVFDGDGRTSCTVDPTNVAAHLSDNYPYGCPTTPLSAPPTQGTSTDYSYSFYNAAGQTTASTNQDGDTTSYTYNVDGQTLTTTSPPTSAAPSGEVTTNCYYYENTSNSSTCPNPPAGGGSANDLYETTTPATSADPTGDQTSYTYTDGGQTDTTITQAGTTTEGYDAAGDLTSKDYSGTTDGYAVPADVTYSYNQDDSRASMTDATGTTVYSYDAAGDVTGQQLTASASGDGLANSTVSYSYYPDQKLDTTVYPSYSSYSDPTVTYSYDATGAMVSETDWLGNKVTFRHDQDGNSTSQDNNVSSTNPNGTSSTAWSYDNADYNENATTTASCGTLTQNFEPSGSPINPDGQLEGYTGTYGTGCSGTNQSRYFNYDAAGQVSYQGSSSSTSTNFAYDDAGDPTVIREHTAGTIDFYNQTFDGAGEITQQNPQSGSGGTTTNYSYDTIGDQVKAATSSGTTTYTYNQSGQLTEAETPGGTTNYVYDGDGLETAAGSPFGTPIDVDGSTTFMALSCTTASFCMAVDHNGQYSIFNGSTWSTPQNIDDFIALESVSCLSTSFCAAVDGNGNFLVYTISGSGGTWTTALAPDPGQVLESVSCVSTTDCLAVDKVGYAFTLTYNSGSGTWSAASSHIDGSHAFEAISCISSGFCAAVDDDGYADTYSSGSWGSSMTEVNTSSTSINAVSCVSSSFCMAVDNSGHPVEYANSGSGGTWTVESVVDSTHQPQSIDCTSSSFCEVGDNAGNVLSDSAGTWSALTNIDNAYSINAVGCTSTTSCVAADGQGNVFTYDGSAWSPAVSIATPHILGAISCVSSSFCMAVDHRGYYATYTNGAWNKPFDFDYDHSVNGLSCTTSTFCAAVDGTGTALIYNSGSWTSYTGVDTNALEAVSCTSSTFCVAVDNAGSAFTWNGSSWTSEGDIDASNPLNAVSCVSTTFCVAVGNGGDSITYTGSWTSPAPYSQDIDSTRNMQAISCVSSSFCTATDSLGHAVELTSFNTTSHTWTHTLDTPDSGNILESVSCPTSSYCQAGDNQGNIFTYNGSSWSSANAVDPGEIIEANSCPTTSFCEAADNIGNTVLYNSSSTTNQFTWNTTGGLPLILTDGTNDYIYGPSGEPVEQINLSSGTVTYLTYSATNDTWVSTSETGTQTGYWGYDAYGTLAFGTPTSPFGYSGQYLDATTGLVNDRARFYQPVTGGFTTRDPDFASTDTAYTYAGNDPVNNSDPTGDWQVPVLGWCIGHCEENSETPLAGFKKSYPGYSPFSLLQGGYGRPECGSTCGFVLNDVKQYWHDTFPDLRAGSGAVLTMLEFITSSYEAGTAPGEQMDPSDQSNCLTVQSCLSNVLLPELNPGESADDLLLVSKDDTLVWWGLQLSDNGTNPQAAYEFADSLDRIENLSEPLQAVGELGLEALASYSYNTGPTDCSSGVGGYQYA